MSEITLKSGAEWASTTVDFGVNYDGNVDTREGAVSGVSIACGAGMIWLIIIVICFIAFCVFYPNESE